MVSCGLSSTSRNNHLSHDQKPKTISLKIFNLNLHYSEVGRGFGIAMALLGSNLAGEAGLRLLLCPLGSNIVIRTACCSVGIALPVYSTFKAIESRDQNAQRKCLLYWAAYGSFSLIEVFTDKLISWFPMYYHLKFAFLVWLQLPSTNGAKQIYMKHLRPFLSRHQAMVDQVLGIASCEVIKLVSSYQSEIQFVRSMVGKITGSADHTLRGAAESDRSRQPNPAEDPAVPSDAESDQINNN
ncbi:HVA22-like protein k [Stylosanthes scabra]|uniref:HVA22-like protein n=1 Tax=Stylosanthes scabra TaxID=79078 RepID=A0ABU6U4V4_9FABA|nr:HVA22-like protein k [Stylosanthes scabra]